MSMIRRSQPADIGILHQIWLEAVQETHHFLTALDIDAISKEVRNLYLPSQSFDVALDSSGALVAFMGMTENKIDSLFVHPRAFGQGVGSSLMKKAQAEFDVLFVDVNEANPNAVRFYQKQGFKVIERTETDDQGRPFPLLRLKWENESN